jgi:serine/threonine-protein kinase
MLATGGGIVIGTLLHDRYRLEERLGSGGMSTVYRAFDETLERPVAIKVMHREFSSDANQLERFRREARSIAGLSHPHVVTVIDAGEDDGRPYIVLEFVEGETLKDRIRRAGPLPAGEAVAYAIEVGRALQAAHAARLVHRDIKPQNVLIDRDGRAKVTDFGIARSLETEGLTAAGRVLGTTDYVSPEQALGEPVTPQSDIYSLGVCLYEMLAGEAPFAGDTHVTVAMKHVREPMPDVRRRRPDVSAALAAVVERATAKERANRYGAVEEMVHDLEEVLAIEAARAGETTGEATSVLQALPEDAAEVAPGRLRRPRRAFVLTLLVIALVAGGIVALVLRAEPGTPGGAAKPDSEGLSEVRIARSGIDDYDPEGGDGESPDAVRNAIDENPSTVWTTELYQTNFGEPGQKSGVGLTIETDPLAARRLDIITPTPGFDVDVYASNAESVPGAVGDWDQRVGGETDVGEEQKIRLGTGVKYTRYLLWITNLPPGGRAEITELTLLE